MAAFTRFLCSILILILMGMGYYAYRLRSDLLEIEAARFAVANERDTLSIKVDSLSHELFDTSERLRDAEARIARLQSKLQRVAQAHVR